MSHNNNMKLEQAIEELVNRALTDKLLSIVPEAPELCRIADIVDETKVDRATIDALVHGSPDNGFPAIRLGPKTIRIDRRRFYTWLNAGGLSYS